MSGRWKYAVLGRRSGSTSVDPAEIIAALRAHGAVWIRDFDLDSDGFERLSGTIGERFLAHMNPARRRIPGDGYTVGVTGGGGRIDLHAEMAYSPFRPDLVWFHCVRAAADGGATVLVDGVELLGQMTPACRSLFRMSRLVHVFRDMNRWAPFLGGAPDRLPPCVGMPGVEVEFDAAGALSTLSFTASAVVKTRFSGEEAFAASLLDWGFSFDEVVLEGGRAFDRAILTSVTDLGWSLGSRVCMEAGDVLLLDNSRIMHGRESYTDEDRDVRLRMSAAR